MEVRGHLSLAVFLSVFVQMMLLDPVDAHFHRDLRHCVNLILYCFCTTHSGAMDRGIKNRTLPRLRQEEAPEPEPWCPQELQNSWERGNRRRPLPSNHSDSHKVDLYRLQLRWKAFCHRLRRPQEWKVLIKTLTFDNKSLGESFIRCFMRDSELRKTRQTINAKSSIRVYTRKLGGLYKKDTGNTDLIEIIFANTADASSREIGLRREPKVKSPMGRLLHLPHLLFLGPRYFTFPHRARSTRQCHYSP